ncbi:MAG: hypothetical protein HQ495_05305 [Alphaproteobacteria bacterium]|nr:hypothetical protein [Alphaproteobacteria bacterium]
MFTYELYVFERGRWMLESSFAADQRNQALDLARRIEAHRSADGIQVIRERIDPTNGGIERSTVYNTWRRRKAMAWREARGDDPGPYADVLREEPLDDLLPEPIYLTTDGASDGAPATGPVVAKLIAIALASFGLATLVTAVHSGATAGALGL